MAGFFWTNPFARRKVKIRNGMGGKTSRSPFVRPPIMITLQPINEFKRLDGKVYWGRHIINGADFDSFEPLNAIWAGDNRHIYITHSPLRGADRDTFCVLNKIFAKDKNKVYFLSGSIQDANPATFRALDAGWFVSAWNLESCQGYAADDVHVFHYVLTIGKPRLVLKRCRLAIVSCAAIWLRGGQGAGL